MINKTVLNEWQEAINNMSYEKLLRSLEDPSFYQEYKDLVKNRMVEVEKEMAHVYDVFIKTLKKRRIKYELGDDKDIFFFTYNRKRFRAELDCECDFVIIHLIHDIFIDKEEEAKLSRLGKAVNEVNKICRVNTFYEENEENGYFFVVSSATILFLSENSNFEMEFKMTLESCLTARDLLKMLMKRIHNKRDKLDS